MINLRSFLASLFIHSLIIFILLGLFKISAKSSAKYIEIDLSLTNLITNSLKDQGRLEKKREKKISKIVSKSYINKKQKIERRVKISKEQEPILKKDLSEKFFMKRGNEESLKEENKQISMSENTNVNNADKEKGAIRKTVQNISMIKNIGESGIGEGGKGNIGEDEGGSEKIKEKFLLKKLFLISKIIQNNITYPYIARKMGWEGKVIISFVLTKEGKINFLTVEKSSGYDVLDKNAIKTIKKVSKYFPLPPHDVKISIPILYKLD